MNPPPFALGLIGYPLAKSLSPELHQAALRASGLSGEYILYPVEPLPQGQTDLAAMIQRLRKRELHGLNVTIPHKQNVLPFVDAVTPVAAAAGAVNTLIMGAGCLTGDNTDIPGFMADLESLLPGLRGYALVLGAGGSARAVVNGLASAGCQVTVAARRLEQATSLLESLHLTASARAIRLAEENLGEADEPALIVNTTPVGMFPGADDSPWPEGLPLPPNAAVYDLVYKPRETRLMRQAKSAGLQAFNGLGMLVEQAALSFERWTGTTANREAMWQAVSGG